MKKILAILLTVCMVVCMIPGAAFAGENPPIDLSGEGITISVTNNSNQEIVYYTRTDVGTNKEAQDNFLANSVGTITVKNGNDVIESSKYVVDKVISGNTVRITVKGNDVDTAGVKIKDIEIVSEVFNNAEYFISNNSVASSATSALDNKIFTGANIEPTIYVYKKDENKGNILIDRSMYSVEYKKKKDAGTAEIIVEGKNGAAGTITNGFIIDPVDFSATSITYPSIKIVSSEEYAKAVVVKLGSNVLETKNYTVTFKEEGGSAFDFSGDFKEGKTYTVKVAPAGSNFTTNSVSKEYSFKMSKEFSVKDGNKAEVKLDKTNFVYNGAKQTPVVTIANAKENTNYTVSYLNSAGNKVTSPTDVGEYTLIVEAIEGMGFEGKTEIKFTISQLEVQPKSNVNNYVYISGLTDQKYTAGAVLKPSFTVYYKATPSSSAKALIKDTDYTVIYSNNTSIGTGRVTVNFKGNYKGESLTGTFTISNGTLLNSANTTISGVNDTYDYTGYAIKPTVYVTYKSGYTTKALTQSTATRTYDYKVDYSSNIAAGTATITVTGQGEYTGTVTKTFKIKYNLSNATVTATPSTYLYDGKEKKPLVSVKVGYMIVPASNYNVVYSNNTNTGTAAVTVTANKYGNAIGSNSTYFTIKGKDGVITPEYAEYSKKTTKSKPFAIKIVSNTTDGTGYSYVSSDTSVATVSANGTVTPVGCGRTVITITTTGNKAYNPATATVTVTVKPTKGIISSLKSTAKGKLTVGYKKQSPNADYYQIRYGRAGDYTTKTIKNTSAPTGKSTIKGLQSGKKYFIKVRGVKVLEDGTRLYGAWSVTKNAVTK